ncbi:hypothetical protein A2515_05905 [Candidatus Falkowbacteria bacterium RIFOXYD12_FULL_34_57]|nr:MAG: hypothetical protein A2515_05905 [Candidatus Falkowbacteria bacterium RIFOXYD12_FULL_34_57]
MLDKWKIILGNIKDNFGVEDEGVVHLEDEGGVDIEYIEFNGPLGRIRLELITRPVILDKKTTYSKRIGSDTKVDYIYSADEKSHILMAYKWSDDNNDWEEMDASSYEQA